MTTLYYLTNKNKVLELFFDCHSEDK